MTRPLGRPAVVVGVALIFVAAFAVRLTQPSAEDQQAPFVTAAEYGHAAEGRDLVLIAHDAYLADRVTTSSWIGATDGVWLVVDATIGAKLGVATPYATLTVDGVHYTSSDRPGTSALGASLDAGLPQVGSFVFEMPRSVLENPNATSARVRFATAFQVRLDSAIDLTLDLTALDRRRTTHLQDPGIVLP